jgi:hypothetical protein
MRSTVIAPRPKQGKNTTDPTLLYSDWATYDRVFPLAAEEIDCYQTLLDRHGPVTGWVADLGAGGGALAAALRLRWSVLAIDLLAGARGAAVRGDLSRPPLRSGVLGASVCRLFGVAYAAGAAGGVAPVLAALGRCHASGATAVWEWPMAWRPERLQGLEEHAPLPGGGEYRFRYLDVLAAGEWGAILATRIEVTGPANRLVEAPLAVLRLGSVAATLAGAGWQLEAMYPSYDAGEATLAPPEDCLRGVVVMRAGLSGAGGR